MSAAPTLRNGLAILILLFVSSMGASSNVSARLSLDEGTGSLLALLLRSAAVLLLMASFMTWRGDQRHIPGRQWPWVIALGLLVTTQGFSIYSALARIPVALALLAINSFPIILMLMNWVFNGRRPTPAALALTVMMLIGLALALEVPQRVLLGAEVTPEWLAGVLFALTAATAFASTLWITEHRIANLPGTTRNAVAMAVVVTMTLILHQTGLLTGAMNSPASTTGQLSLIALVGFYCMAYCILFLLAPRLNMARNAPVMNMEPIIAMVLAWWILQEILSPLQLTGAALVVAGVVALSRVR